MRKLFGCLSVALIVLVIAGYLGLRGLRFLLAGTPPDVNKLALEGQPTVQAIYEFKQHTGLWPIDLNELTPEYLPKPPGPEWVWHYPYLSTSVSREAGVNYNFIPPDESWSFDGESGTGHIAVTKPSTTRPAPTPDQQFANAMAVLDARIQRDPKEFKRRQEKIRFLVHRGHRAEALDLATQVTKAFPEHWWPPMAVTELSSGEANTSAVTALSDWADHYPCFNNYWYVAEYFRQHQQPDMALKTLDKAAGYPAELSRPVDQYIPDWMCFNAAAYACKSKKYELALKICQQWDSMAQAQGYGGNDALAIRAAAYLGLGRVAEARSFAARAIEHDKKQRGWAGNLDRLNAAAQAGDSSFVYDAEAGQPATSRPLDLFESFGADE